MEKAGRAKADKREAKRTQMVSRSDFEVRRMRLADGSVHPAWNVQVATAKGFVVSIEPTDRRNDSGLALSLVEQIERRCGQTPVRLRADGTAMTVQDIAAVRSVCYFQAIAHNLLDAHRPRCAAA